MKIAFYIEDEFEQIVLTPGSPTERAILERLHDGEREFRLRRGSFYEANGGWMRYKPAEAHPASLYGALDRQSRDDVSTMIVLVPAKPPEPALPPMSHEAALVLDAARNVMLEIGGPAAQTVSPGLKQLADAIQAHDASLVKST